MSDQGQINLVARPYQIEMAEIAKRESVIVKLDTGLGKTFIAVMVIKHMLPITYRPLDEGGRRIIFIVKTVHLVYQHAATLRYHLPVKSDEVGVYHGQVSPGVWIDSWVESIWRKQLEAHRVLIFTAGVFRDLLNHNKINLRDVCQLIFDECHHADPNSNSDYTDICQHLASFPPGRWRQNGSRGPKVLGLSASLVNNVLPTEDLSVRLAQLEGLLRARIVTSWSDSVATAKGNRILRYVPYRAGGSQILPGDRYCSMAEALMRGVERLSRFSRKCEPEVINLEQVLDANDCVIKELFSNSIQAQELSPKKFLGCLRLCIGILDNYGPWCCNEACGMTEQPFQKLITCSTVLNQETREIISASLEVLRATQNVYADLSNKACQTLIKPVLPEDESWGSWLLNNYPMSNKTGTLVRALLQFKRAFPATPTQGNFNTSLSALVIVKERLSSAVLSRLITTISDACPLYHGLRAAYCVSANPSRCMTAMTTGEQQDALQGFRRGMFNVLVATDVIEEGLDIRSCNVVVKTEAIANYRSFIQSQGRARAPNSYFVLMTDDRFKCEMSVNSYKMIERQVASGLSSRALKDDDSSNDDEPSLDSALHSIALQSYMPFGANGPRITPTGAASVLMRVQSHLPGKRHSNWYG